MIGTTLDKYEVLQKVGEGGMATVYRGRHTTLRRDVAIKVLHPHLSSSLRNRKRFAREARAIEQLRHTNILEIFDYSGTDCSDCYIITEFVEGETLAALMSRLGPLPSEVAAMLGIELALALGYAHGAGILHRDLKPDNVMLRADGTVKLMDFGIARFLDESQVTMTGALVGSPAFMSPEQAREEPLDARSDLFSLGTLLFFLVTGHLPFSGSNPSLILKNIIEGNRPGVSDLAPMMSASLADVIEQLLQPDRDQRPGSAHEVADALRRVLEEVGLPDGDPGWGVDAFLRDPAAYRERLEAHLRVALFERGKALLARGEHLSALRLFNRLLSLDDDNPEVLALVQGLHGAREQRPASRWAALVGAGVVSVAAAALLLWARPGVDAPTPPSPAPAVSPVTASQGGSPDVSEPPPPASEPPPSSPSAPLPVSLPTEPPPPVRVTPSPRPIIAEATRTRRLRERAPVAAPPAADPDAPPAEPAPPATAEIRVRGPYWAEIYEDGRNIGSTRQREPIEVAPGQHTVVLRSPLMEDHPIEFTVAPGERFVLKDVVMTPKPVSVRLDPAFEDACTVILDNEPLGIVGELGREIPLPRPDQSHMMVVQCGDRVYPRKFTELVVPVDFPREDPSGDP